MALGWGFAWPANRRIMYNRASADPHGNPWPKEARLARQFGKGAKGYVYWDPEAEGPDPADPSKVVSGRWVGLDVPDFPVTKPPTAAAKPDGLGLDFHDGASPFIMKADGKGWLFAPSRPGRRPAARPLRAVRVAGHEPGLSRAVRATRRPRSSPSPGNPYAPVGSAEYPVRPLDLPPDRAPPERLDEPLAPLAGRAAARALRRAQPRARRARSASANLDVVAITTPAPRSTPRPW